MRALKDILSRAVNSERFLAWLLDWVDGDQREANEALGDEELLLEYLDTWLGECGIAVEDDTDLVTFDVLYADDDCQVREVIGNLPILLYHHTATGALDDIRDRGGLVPGLDLGQKSTTSSSKMYVFLTTEVSGPAVSGYQFRAVQRYGGDPVTLEISTTLDQVHPDPDDEDISSGARQFVVGFVPLSDISGVGP